MSSFFLWLLILVCLVALIVLFFPFRFLIEFEAHKNEFFLKCYILKKIIWKYEKYLKWQSTQENEDADENFEPTFVESIPRQDYEAKKLKQSESEKIKNQKIHSNDIDDKKISREVLLNDEKKSENLNSESFKKIKPSNDFEQKVSSKKIKKRKLTDKEFWTILLTPDLDNRTFDYVKSLLKKLIYLFRIKFIDCFVEGIFTDYRNMGYLAQLNAIMKGFPYLKSWDIRMDWCNEKQFCTKGKIFASINLCRIFFFLIMVLFYASILFFLFWRRRASVLKTNELPELGFIRKKILNLILEK